MTAIRSRERALPIRSTDLELLDEHQASEILQIRLATLRKWRLMGKGPRFVRLGRLVGYQGKDVFSWIDSRRVMSETREAEERPAGAA